MEDFILGVLLAIVAYLVWTKKVPFDSIVNRFRELNKNVVSVVSTSPQDPSLAIKRAQIITEIVDTERSYNKSLNSLLTAYIEPLQSENSSGSNSPLSSPKLGFRTKSTTLSKDEIKNIFLVPSLESIIQLSNTILTRLESRIKDKSPCVADIFVELAQFLKCYTTYINGLNNSFIAFRNTTKTNKKFKEFIEKQKTLPGVDHVDSLMIMPVQRIPRYILLLKELQKTTPTTHSDYKNIQEAVVLIENVASLLNESKKIAENMQQVFELEHLLQLQHDVTRKLIKSGQIIMGKEKMLCYLFNDRFVVATEKKKPKANQVLTAIDLLESKSNGFVIKVGRVDTELMYTSEAKADTQWYADLSEAVDSAKAGRLSLED